MQGQVKKIIGDKGFGFVSGEDGKDVFLHHSAFEGNLESLQEGNQVEFDIEQGPKGPKAANAKKA